MISTIFLGLVYTPQVEVPSSSIGERVTILDSADHEIEALVVEAKKPRGIAIFCHESGFGKTTWEKYAYFLPMNGFHLVAPDTDRPQSTEERSGLSQWPEEREVQRLEVVSRWARRVYGANLPVIFFGVSKGANLALAASVLEPKAAAVVADGLFSMREIFRDYIRKWAPVLVRPNLFGEKYPDWIVQLFAGLGYWNSERISKRQFIDVESLLRREHPPLLLIHGELDDYVPVTHQKLLEQIVHQSPAGRKGGDFSRLQVPQARHNEAVAVAREAYERCVLSFLDEALS